MALCGISSGFDFDCNSLKRVSGVKKVWLFNLDDLASQIDPNGTGYVTGLEFSGYDGLYSVDSRKFSHDATSTLNVAESGAVTWQQAVTLRLFVDTPTEVATLSDLAVATVGAIVLTNNNEFRIYGAEAGLSANAGTSPTGRNQGEDTTTTITLGGEEKLPYRIFLRNGDFNTSLAYIEALEF